MNSWTLNFLFAWRYLTLLQLNYTSRKNGDLNLVNEWLVKLCMCVSSGIYICIYLFIYCLASCCDARPHPLWSHRNARAATRWRARWNRNCGARTRPPINYLKDQSIGSDLFPSSTEHLEREYSKIWDFIDLGRRTTWSGSGQLTATYRIQRRNLSNR